MYCTCKDTNCPLHPTNHDKGCTPCMQKNLKLGEIPNCYFNLFTENTSELNNYSIESFARIVLKNSNDEKC